MTDAGGQDSAYCTDDHYEDGEFECTRKECDQICYSAEKERLKPVRVPSVVDGDPTLGGFTFDLPVIAIKIREKQPNSDSDVHAVQHPDYRMIVEELRHAHFDEHRH